MKAPNYRRRESGGEKDGKGVTKKIEEGSGEQSQHLLDLQEMWLIPDGTASGWTVNGARVSVAAGGAFTLRFILKIYISIFTYYVYNNCVLDASAIIRYIFKMHI